MSYRTAAQAHIANSGLVETLVAFAGAPHDLRSIQQEAMAQAAAEIERLRASLTDCQNRYSSLLDQLGAGADMVGLSQQPLLPKETR